MILSGFISFLFILIEIACGIVMVIRFRGSPGAILGGIAFGIWALSGILRPVLGAFDVGWWQYGLAFSIPSLAAYGCLLAALITGRVYNQAPAAAGGGLVAPTGSPVPAAGPVPAGGQVYTGGLAPTGQPVPRPISEVLFSFKGRISRSDYWLRGFLILLPIGIFNNILMYGVRSPGARALAMIIGLACTWPSLALLSKRLHDRNRRALWLLTLLIPFADIVFAVWILVEVWFLKGTDGPNRFGEDPLRRGVGASQL
jgi:uncharacterized membrane protein YhaH (DUF805 family)